MARTLLCLLIPGLLGCERVVDLVLDEGPVRLVIEARVELLDGRSPPTQRVRLTTTDALSADRDPPPVSGATVQIADDDGRSWILLEGSTPGVYETSQLVASLGRRYTLTIDYDGDRYEGTDVLIPGPPIDSLYFEFEAANIAVGDSGYRAAIDYTDPAGRRNYYFWEQFADGETQITADPGNRFRVISADDFYDGATITAYQPFDEAIIEPGQEVLLRQVALSERAYRYLFALFEQAGGDQGSPFSAPPASVRGNMANLTTPERYPLGYFLAAEVAEARATLILR